MNKRSYRSVIAKKKYRVYFNQINQTYIDIDASNPEEARIKAEKEWIKENPPDVMGLPELLEE
jgi:hypothetical protein